jgi:DNA-binding response OmpR family regulator
MNISPEKSSAFILECPEGIEESLRQLLKGFSCSNCLVKAAKRPDIVISRNDALIKTFPLPIRAGQLIDTLQKLSETPAISVLPIGSYFLNLERMSFDNADGTLRSRLTDKERDILLYLVQKPSKNAERQELLRAVWGYSDQIETHTLETHVYRLRQKIEEDAAAPVILISYEGGYKLGV